MELRHCLAVPSYRYAVRRLKYDVGQHGQASNQQCWSAYAAESGLKRCRVEHVLLSD